MRIALPSMLPTAIGSLPHRDPVAAVAAVRRHLPACPVWPQMPRRTWREQMSAQFSEGIPGMIDGEAGMRFDPEADQASAGSAILQLYLETPGAAMSIGRDRAAGLYALAEAPPPAAPPVAVKGQITGPLTLGLSLTDPSGLPLLHREAVMDSLVKVLAMRARWQERFLARLSPRTIIFLDEPALSTYGSGFVAYDRGQVAGWLTEVLGALEGLRGVHCCGSTDWSFLMARPVDIVSFDAWGFVEEVALHASAIRGLLRRGGRLAWGIVPAAGEELARLTGGELADRLEAAIERVAAEGVDRGALLEQSLVTPSCGLASLDEDAATWAMELTARVSAILRERYDLEGEV
ncbi:MAG TPA: methionine synthase [Bacillota bacterium]|nr:methionine synthase [Bacillota bacterium]